MFFFDFSLSFSRRREIRKERTRAEAALNSLNTAASEEENSSQKADWLTTTKKNKKTPISL